MTGINEAIVEDATLDIFRSLGYHTLHGPDIGPGGDAEERSGWDEVIRTYPKKR
jgi:type I restriction enzyme, R subunit